MRPKRLLGLLIPIAFAALFVRLGFWQVSRHQEKAAYNARVSSRLNADPVAFAALPRDSALQRGQRVMLAGRFLYASEQVQAGLAEAGRPAVRLITPLEREGTDTVVAVVRGSVFSPDAAQVDRTAWREADSVSLRGYALPLLAEGRAAPADSTKPLRALNAAALSARFHRPVAPVLVVMTSDSAARDSVPIRLGPPTVSMGNHRSYAIQWFCFALIALVGGVILFRRTGVRQ